MYRTRLLCSPNSSILLIFSIYLCSGCAIGSPWHQMSRLDTQNPYSRSYWGCTQLFCVWIHHIAYVLETTLPVFLFCFNWKHQENPSLLCFLNLFEQTTSHMPIWLQLCLFIMIMKIWTKGFNLVCLVRPDLKWWLTSPLLWLLRLDLYSTRACWPSTC